MFLNGSATMLTLYWQFWAVLGEGIMRGGLIHHAMVVLFVAAVYFAGVLTGTLVQTFRIVRR